jgi:hypothetical protein
MRACRLTDRAVQEKEENAMNPYPRLFVMLISFTVGLLLLWNPRGALAQTASPDAQSPASSDSSSQKQRAKEKERGHFSLSPYLWFAGTRGTVGALGNNASVHASAGDLLSHFNMGLMGAAEARYDRVLMNGDMMWIRLSDSRALPFPNVGAVTADARIGEFVWTSKIGYRLIDRKIKADANVGIRYWQLGQKLNFHPSPQGITFNTSQNWADLLVGGRVRLPLGERVFIDLVGDVGGWGAAANLDYQFAPMLGFTLNPKWTLGAGYRYLFIDYRNGAGIVNLITSGAIAGLTYSFK